MSKIQKEADENFEAFQRESRNLTAHRGKYFLMRRGKIINFYDTLQDAHSTGAAVYADNSFSVCFLKGAKKTAKKQAAKKQTGQKKAKTTMAALAAMTPRREDIPGIARELPDISDWRQAAGSPAMRIRPFFTGADSKPFSCMRASQIRIEPPIRRGGIAFPVVNDFFLAQECR